MPTGWLGEDPGHCATTSHAVPSLRPSSLLRGPPGDVRWALRLSANTSRHEAGQKAAYRETQSCTLRRTFIKEGATPLTAILALAHVLSCVRNLRLPSPPSLPDGQSPACQHMPGCSDSGPDPEAGPTAGSPRPDRKGCPHFQGLLPTKYPEGFFSERG